MKRVPAFRTDAEAEAFLEQDLSDLGARQFVPIRFRFVPRDEPLDIRLPAALLDAIRARARARGVPFSRYVRMVLEADIGSAGQDDATRVGD